MATGNESFKADPHTYATKLDLADLRLEFKEDIANVRVSLAQVDVRLDGLETRMDTLQKYMRMIFWFQGGILVALIGGIITILLKSPL